MTGRQQTFNRLLRLFEPGRLVDLGAGHGIFSRIAANEGWRVVAVDARTDRWPDDDRISWVQDDVRNHNLRPYDLIACLGLFYHLTCVDQIDLIKRSAGRPIIIDTHLDHGEHTHVVSERMVNEFGYEGVLYKEPGKTTSSWGNPESFWPTHESFMRMLTDNGYATVLTVEPWKSDRTFFVALPDEVASVSPWRQRGWLRRRRR